MENNNNDQKDFITEWRKNNNLREIPLPRKQEIYHDLFNLDHSISGRIDFLGFGNTFLTEAIQLTTNAIEIFEQGYFDCAYYSLRSAIEISTLMVFFHDLPTEERAKFKERWRANDIFPQQKQVIETLVKQGDVFADMREKMFGFFEQAKILSNQINKFVHKQGLENFYVVRNRFSGNNPSYDINEFSSTFEDFVVKVIGVLAIMRLAIDPLPVLLMEEEICQRYPGSMTTPFSRDFVAKYIDEGVLNSYKLTNIYAEHKKGIMENLELQHEEVYNLNEYDYIDTQKETVLKSQFHLLSQSAIVAVLTALSCEKVVKVHCYRGMLSYWTDRKSNRNLMSSNSADFDKFSKSTNRFNQTYDETLISVYTFLDEDYFIEHNDEIALDDICKILEVLNSCEHLMPIKIQD